VGKSSVVLETYIPYNLVSVILRLPMRYVSATDAKQNFAAMLDAAQRGPVVIRRQARDAAVLISPQDYDRLRGLAVAELDALCARVSTRASAAGLTANTLDALLRDDG